jgi:DNA-directed RNA polymerase specialized sigma24 family protein
VPRSEADATLVLVRPDGSTRLYTRAELSAAIDRLRPRQRQILRLSLEERWSRQRICEYLRHISLKTFERDQGEGLDILAQM